MEDALSALHLRHAAYRLCSRLSVTLTAAELAAQLTSGEADRLLRTTSAAAICRGTDEAEAAGAGHARHYLSAAIEQFWAGMHDWRMCSHAASPANDTELLTVFRAACSAFAHPHATAGGGFATRCEATCTLEMLLKAITTRVRLDNIRRRELLAVNGDPPRNGLKCVHLREGSGVRPHATQALATEVSGELAQLLDQALAQHRQAAASACAGKVSTAAAEAIQHLLCVDLSADQARHGFAVMARKRLNSFMSLFVASSYDLHELSHRCCTGSTATGQHVSGPGRGSDAAPGSTRAGPSGCRCCDDGVAQPERRRRAAAGLRCGAAACNAGASTPPAGIDGGRRLAQPSRGAAGSCRCLLQRCGQHRHTRGTAHL